MDDEFEEAFDVNGLVFEFHEQLFLEPTVPEHVGQVLCVLFDPQVSLRNLAHLYLLLDQLHLFFSAIIYPKLLIYQSFYSNYFCLAIQL